MGFSDTVPCTEIVYIPTKAGDNPKDFGTPKGKVYKEILDAIIAHGKPQNLYWGHQVEDPSLYFNILDWDNVGAHRTFQKWSGYPAFVDSFQSLVSGTAFHFHANLEPHPPTAVYDAEASELLQLYFPLDYSEEDQKVLHENVSWVGQVIKAMWPGCRGASSGWALEELDLPDGSAKAKVYIVMIGWESVDSHTKYRDSKTFDMTAHHLVKAKGLVTLQVGHIVAQKYP